MDPVSMVDVFSTALEVVKSDFLGMAAVATPIGLAIFGVTFGIRKAKALMRAAS